jgi:hypothetical protein
MSVSQLKGFGYGISALSVLLLGLVSWKNASEEPVLLAALVLGMIASILGMLLRWLSHLRQRREEAPSPRLSPKPESRA